MNSGLFPQRPDATPMIYAYSDTNPAYEGMLKVGYTAKSVPDRVAQQYPTVRPGKHKPYKIEFSETAMREDGSFFTDRDVHRILKMKGVEAVGGEWFRCSVEDVRAAWLAVKTRTTNVEDRTQNFSMRPEQEEAVQKTKLYFESVAEEPGSKIPKFLWNAKMRFGKTFATYQLAKTMGFKKVLVLTFKPAVQSAWHEDLTTHLDFEGWQFIDKDSDLTYETADLSRPIVCFGSFQDYLGVNNETGGIKAKNEWVHEINWDMVVFDEYHFGAWKEKAQKLFEIEDEEDLSSEKAEDYDRASALDETWLPITSDYYLYLSGTPFRALNSGEFIEEQVYSWTYSDEQQAKAQWVGDDNPYEALPRMVMLTYKIPDSIRRIAMKGEYDEFDLNLFFSATGSGDKARFTHEEYVQKWLDLIRGSYLESTTDDLKLGRGKPAMPFSDTRLLSVLSHTLWFMPDVASCYAMANLMRQTQNSFYHDYRINVAAGPAAGIGVDALAPVRRSMADPLNSKTITLTCGKLTTGVTVKPWTGVFMLRNLRSPETYFQTAFRAQSPWEIETEAGKKEIIKKECYVLDFALDRALKQIADYSSRLNMNEDNPERKVAQFIKFLPVIAYDGSSMRQIDASEILDYTMSGTTATLLARRWESALLVNVDNDTLARLMANEEAMRALMSIEGFRSLNQDIEIIINKSNAVKKARKGTEPLTPAEKRHLTQEEKDYQSRRNQIREKLIKFATRIPIYMYLTDYREYTLKDVITKLEPMLFKKVTGLSIRDFDLLISLNVFNGPLMNDAVYNFKRYEDSSLSYTGLPSKHKGKDVGLYDTVLSAEDYALLNESQQYSMHSIGYVDDELPESLPSDFDDLEEDDEIDEIVQVRRVHEAEDPLAISPVLPKKPTLKQSQKAERIQGDGQEDQNDLAIDVSGVKVGSILTHKAFGEGVVVQMGNDFVVLDFKGSTKMYRYPGSILQGFLILTD